MQAGAAASDDQRWGCPATRAAREGCGRGRSSDGNDRGSHRLCRRGGAAGRDGSRRGCRRGGRRTHRQAGCQGANRRDRGGDGCCHGDGGRNRRGGGGARREAGGSATGSTRRSKLGGRRGLGRGQCRGGRAHGERCSGERGLQELHAALRQAISVRSMQGGHLLQRQLPKGGLAVPQAALQTGKGEDVVLVRGGFKGQRFLLYHMWSCSTRRASAQGAAGTVATASWRGCACR
mmetsp:Transcript_47804/g.133296  ORF Transcript_47804/g.133296 Transcript_47804/m.133296 type:complete len:234 (+) Transcript_47804:375-1076(+)